MKKITQVISVLLLAALLLTAMPVSVHAEMTMNLSLAPHCTEVERTTCPLFEVIDGSSVKTGKLTSGDILDIDVVVSGPDFAAVRTVRAWLNYDPSVLEYRSVELTSELPSPTLGEQTGDAVGKVVKIAGSTEKGLSGNTRAVARVTFRVLSNTSNSVVSFNNYQADGSGNTAINGAMGASSTKSGTLSDPPCIDTILGCKGTYTPLLSVEPSSLIVTLQDTVAAPDAQANSSSSSSATSAIVNTTTAEAPQNTSDSTFGILQVQGVKVTTRDSLAFVGWNQFRSAGLKGYNVYYSTVSGRYIQRHSVPSTETSVTLRNLAPDTTYYFAVRAVNQQDIESVFSQEVSVTVGKPETASSPLLAMQTIGLDAGGSGDNPMQVHNGDMIRGETGINDVILFLIIGSALTGTLFASRRQMQHFHSLSNAR